MLDIFLFLLIIQNVIRWLLVPPEQVGNEVKKDMNSFNNLLIAHI